MSTMRQLSSSLKLADTSLVPQAVNLLQSAAAAVPHMEQFVQNVCKVQHARHTFNARSPALAHHGIADCHMQAGSTAHMLTSRLQAPLQRSLSA